MTKVLHDCNCDPPRPWQDARGNKTNVCRDCGGKIVTLSPPIIGKLHTHIDKVILGDLDLEPDHPFIGWLTQTIDSNIRHSFLTWNHNTAIRVTEEAKKAKAEAKKRAEADT